MTLRSPRFKIGNMSLVVYPSRVAGWSGTPQALEPDR
jgi:hypothetical protein